MDSINQSDDLTEQYKRLQKPTTQQQPQDDEGTMEYAERPAFVAMDKQESLFDSGSLNRQNGINTQPSIFHSTWK